MYMARRYTRTMSRRLNLFIPEHLDSGLKALKEQQGTPEAETIRRALTAYLKDKGVLKEDNRPRRKRVSKKRDAGPRLTRRRP
jgi:hypothetical protein